MLDGRHEGLPPPSVLRALGWQSLHMQAQLRVPENYTEEKRSLTSKLQQCFATEVYAVQLHLCLRSVYINKMTACVGPQLQVFQEQQHVMQPFFITTYEKTSTETHNLQGHPDIVKELCRPQHSSSLGDH